MTSEYTSSELCVAALFVSDISSSSEVTNWLQQNRRDVRKLLWGNPNGQGNLRVPGESPAEVFENRQGVATSLDFESIKEVYPSAYLAPPWRGFLQTSGSFRDWHIVTHSQHTRDKLLQKLGVLYDTGDVEWAYLVDARGKQKHTHCLVSFTYPTSARSLLSELELAGTNSEEDDDKLCPIWGSFASAREYLYKQATHEEEEGEMPTRRIWVDGRDNTIPILEDRLRAIAQGENTQVHSREGRYTRTKYESKAIRRWIKSKLQIKFSDPERVTPPPPKRFDKRERAYAEAVEASKRYTGRVYSINFKEKLKGVVFEDPPLDWFGEEVLLLLNIPEELEEQQLAADWVRSAARVYYTTA